MTQHCMCIYTEPYPLYQAPDRKAIALNTFRITKRQYHINPPADIVQYHINPPTDIVQYHINPLADIVYSTI